MEPIDVTGGEPAGRQRPLPSLAAQPSGAPVATTVEGGDAPRHWSHGRRAWRLSAALRPNALNLVLRWRGARDLSRGHRARLAVLGLPWDATGPTLRSIHSLADWPVAWTATAQRFLGETRRPDAATADDDDLNLARARLRASACYHVAHWLAYDDARAIRTMRAASVALFSRLAPRLYVDLAPVQLYWRGKSLPGYLRLPSTTSAGPAPLVVLLNGITTSKEELARWADAFLARGQAVLALDQPGTGEAAELGRPSTEHDDLSDAILEFAAAHPTLDERRTALVGISLGGSQAVLAAALDRRIAAVVAVTPPFEPARWIAYVNSIIRDQIVGFAGGDDSLAALVGEFALAEFAPRLQTPALVIGAGRDVVVPPAEAIRLAVALGEWATLLWYADAGHGLYEMLPWWTSDAAHWLDAIFAPNALAGLSTQVDRSDPHHVTPATSDTSGETRRNPPVAADVAPIPSSSDRAAHGGR